MEYPTISGTSGGGAIHTTYGPAGLPTMILIAPDRTILEQDIWPISSVSDIITPLESHGISENSCAVTFEADFSGTPTTVAEGGSVDFTDLSTGTPTSWTWTFDGGTPGTSTDQHPAGIVYNTAGTYTVTLESSDGTSTDTETKTGYITVEPSAYEIPVADFSGSPTNVPVGSTVDFTDLSLNAPTTWEWEFTGADVTTSTDQHPAGIMYSTAGLYPVKLKVTNPAGADSLTKVDYINVFLDTSSVAPDIDFNCDVRLLTVGESTDFTDQSLNYPSSWSWTFDGGTPSSSTDQNPIGITYSTPGIYSVTLTATNVSGSGSLTKTDYIVVSDYPMDQLCDTITNMGESESMSFQALSSTWGYLPGHNGKFVTAYADKHVNYMIDEISSFIFPVAKAYSGGGKVKFKVWEGSTEPGAELAEKQKNVSALTTGLFNVIHFDSPVDVDGEFFVGFEITYAYNDTFAVYMAPDRGSTGINTLYCKKDGNWQTATSLFNVYTSTGINVVGCLTGIETFTINDVQVIIFPNPSSDIFNIDLSTVDVNSIDINVFDITGNLIQTKATSPMEGLYQINMIDQAPGIYFIKMIVNGIPITRKISVSR